MARMTSTMITQLNNANAANQRAGLGTRVNDLEFGVAGAVIKKSETVAYTQFTDGGAAVGTFATSMTIPAGATFLYSTVTAVTGFAGDTSAALTIGDGTTAARYNTSTINVFATAANGVSAGAPSGTVYHTAAKTVTLTITSATDWGAVNAGSVTVSIYYLA